VNTKFKFPVLAALVLLLAACSKTPNPQLVAAQENFTQLQSDPRSVQLSALETKDAADWLERAEKAARDKEGDERVGHLAYLTNQRVEVAKQTINLRVAENAIHGVAALRAQARLEARDAQIKKLQESLNAKQPAAEVMDVKQTDRGSLVTFGDVLFEVGKADLRASAFDNIQRLARFLVDHPERKVIIEGHTDSTGSAALNQTLSQRRAHAVMQQLARNGVSPARIVAQGLGSAYPVADNASHSGRAHNRRVEVTISNDNQAVAPRATVY
jgi:outer membrane protein OmpA-like peptidoglycan-associated protein